MYGSGCGQRLDDFHDRLHLHATPFGDARPGLDAEVLADLVVVWQRLQVVE
jgi:hypothetical protein